MKKKNLIYFANRAIKNTWAESFCRRTCLAFAEDHDQNERWLLEAMLSFNRDGKYFNNSPHEARMRIGDRKKDLLYDLWNEEDVRLSFARNLHEIGGQRCSIHGQVYIKKRKLIGKNRGQIKHKTYPDLYYVIRKEKERNEYAKERNVESGAVEIKYFYRNTQRDQIKKSALRDIRKLVSYCDHGFRPKTDAGFFFCVDETGYAYEILEEIFSRKPFANRRLAFAVYTPTFVKNRTNFPGFYEKIDQDKRRLFYALDLALGKIIHRLDSYQNSEVRQLKDKSLFYFMFKGKLKGWLGFQVRQYSTFSRKKKFSLVVEAKHHLDIAKPIKWSMDLDRWVYTDKQYRCREYFKFAEKEFGSLNKINKIAEKIAKAVRHLHRRAK